MTIVKEPWIISPFFSEDRYKKIMQSINSFPPSAWEYEVACNRYVTANKYLDRLSMYELDRARKEFDSNNLLYSYSLLSLYKDKNSKLEKHKDNNACTYTFDICLYTDKPWPIIIENKEYVINSNEALCFYGEDQLHWRPPFEENNKVLMLFMHFVDKNHWFFYANNTGARI